jgi:low temperature requirement protein LtrA
MSSSKFQFRRFFEAPELHQDWDEKQGGRDVTWTELFYDLYYVGALFNISHVFKAEHPTAHQAGLALLYNTLFYFLWFEHTVTSTRFRLDGLFYDILRLIHQLGVLGMVLAVQELGWYRLFAAGYLLAQAALLVIHVSIYICIPRARALSGNTILSRLVTLALALAVAASPYDTSHHWHVFYILFSVTAFIDAITPSLPFLLPSVSEVPLHVEHMSERLGLFTILYLGEAIIGFSIEPITSHSLEFLGIALSATTIWSLHLIYYHIHPGQHTHAFRQSKARGLLFSYAHWLLGFAFLLTANGLRLIIHTYPAADASGGGGGSSSGTEPKASLLLRLSRSLLAAGGSEEGSTSSGTSPGLEPPKAYGDPYPGPHVS